MVSKDEVEDVLYKHDCVNRNDVADDKTFGQPAALEAALPMRPSRVMDYLGVTPDELIGLVRSGAIPKPANWGGGRVAWRRDEIVGFKERGGRDAKG